MSKKDCKESKVITTDDDLLELEADDKTVTASQPAELVVGPSFRPPSAALSTPDTVSQSSKTVGGARRGAGRPKKILAISDAYDPVKTLKLLKFDPIVACVEAITEVNQKVRWMKRQPKPSMPAIAQLLNTKRALVNDLLRFGYRPVPEKTISEHQFIPIDITLTDQPMSAIGIESLLFGDSALQKDLDEKGTKH